jgi:hypothetical protein
VFAVEVATVRHQLIAGSLISCRSRSVISSAKSASRELEQYRSLCWVCTEFTVHQLNAMPGSARNVYGRLEMTEILQKDQ